MHVCLPSQEQPNLPFWSEVAIKLTSDARAVGIVQLLDEKEASLFLSLTLDIEFELEIIRIGLACSLFSALFYSILG